MLPFGINVTGYVSSNVSLGITARHFIKLFLDHGIPVAIRDLDYGRSEKGRDFQYRDLMIKPGEDPPYSVNMCFLALWQIPRLALELSREFLRDDRVQAFTGTYNGTILGSPKITEPAMGEWKAPNGGAAQTCIPQHPSPGPPRA
jgi:hypothetical protein